MMIIIITLRLSIHNDDVYHRRDAMNEVASLKITDQQTQKNREKILQKASRMFRERGADGPSVGDLMSAAGFTHGGFYNHFDSKTALLGEALQHAFRQMEAVRKQIPTTAGIVRSYLSEEARKAPGSTCPAAALAGDVSRQPESIKDIFADGIEEMISSLLQSSSGAVADRAQSIDLVCRMVGALMLARAMPNDRSLAEEILRTATARCLADLRAPTTVKQSDRKR
ncbi:TetR/AcrR family transcriptional regulator [Rhodopseudomonas palustris]|uniref:TetR/AcrR family transcriptional regulator n=1 Tax=Rhodopseudomonas palustris TaxID=1076 RepID=UPI0020CC64EB|nr:TetR family transcriptional regulator [Rhodopseudomonas palustris]MCP9626544.1 TetR/AcrR family transcriptional regulator [Rhodopseudomonas palustris]